MVAGAVVLVCLLASGFYVGNHRHFLPVLAEWSVSWDVPSICRAVLASAPWLEFGSATGIAAG